MSGPGAPALPPLDDLGSPVVMPDGGARRIVSLVPSLTETLASVDPAVVVGATDWCTHPADLDERGVTRVRGTKNPDLTAIRALAPDVVVANKEENRELDVRRLREAGVAVWVTEIDTVPGAIASIARMLAAFGLPEPTWLDEARSAWGGEVPPPTRTVAIPIWRDPWIVVGGDTFTSDLCRRLGWVNVVADLPRYPALDVAGIQARSPDVVLLPDEPYVFSAEDGPEAFDCPTELVEGRLLTWYGPSLLDAARLG